MPAQIDFEPETSASAGVIDFTPEAPATPFDLTPQAAPVIDFTPEAAAKEEQINPAPTVFGELKAGNFKSAAFLARDAISRALAPTQPTSALQTHGAPPASLLGTSEMLPEDPNDSSVKRAGKAVVNVGNRFMAGLTSPEMLPLFAMGGAPGIGRVVTGAFATDILANIPETWDRIKKAQKTDGWTQERMETVLDTTLQGLMLHGLSKHALGKQKPAAPESRTVPPGTAAPTVLKSFEELPADLVTETAVPIFRADESIPFMVKVRAEDTLKAQGLTEEQIGSLTTPEVAERLSAPLNKPAKGGSVETVPEKIVSTAVYANGKIYEAPLHSQALEMAFKEGALKRDVDGHIVDAEGLDTFGTPNLDLFKTNKGRVIDRITADKEFNLTDSASIKPATRAEPPPERKLTPEEIAAESEYRAQLLEEATAGQLAQGPELKDAIIRAGGLPSRQSPHRTGEITSLEETILNPQRTERVPPNKIFRQDAPPIDELATRLRDQGFEVGTPTDLYNLLDQRFRTEKPIFGIPEKARLAGSDVFGFGPGAASAKEPLASYEKRAFGERLQSDYKLAQELRENTGDRYYEPIPNTVTIEEAIKLTNERPVSDAINAIRDDASGIPFHVRAAMGQVLVKRLNQAFHNLREKNPVEAETVLNHAVETSEWLSNFGTQLGQGVQAFSMWNRLTPEGKLASMQRSVRKTRDRYTAEHGDEVAQITNILNTEGMTDAARFEALRKLFKVNLTARKVKPQIQRLLEAARTGKLTDEKFYEIAGDRLGLPKWDADTAREITRLAGKIEDAPEGMPRDRAAAELSKFIATQNGFDARDVPIGIYYGNMLSGYNTQIVNAGDTFLNVVSELNGAAVANPRAAAKIYHNTLRGFLDGRLDFMSALAKGRMVTEGKWLEIPKLMEIAEFGRKGGVPINVKSRTDAVIKAVTESRPAVILNGWKYVGRLMAATDALMYRAAFEGRMALLGDRVARQEGLRGRALDRRVEELMGRTEAQTHRFEEQAKAEGFTGLDASMRVAELRNMGRSMDARADANDFASLATYNHEPQGWLGYMANGLGRASNKYPLLKLFVPFTRIVANVTNRGLNYTPLGFKRAFYGYERDGALTGDARAAMLTRATFGTLGMTTLAAMQAGGYLEINGAGPSDPDRRKLLDAAGWKPYSLKIGDQYWSYVYTPIGLGLSIIGNMTDSYRYKEMDEKDALTRGTYAFLRIGSTVFSQSFLSGLSNLFQGLSNRPAQALPALKNIFASTVGSSSTPRIILDVQRLFDPTRYRSDTLAGDLLRNTPFAALANRPVLNAFGEPTINPSNRFVSSIKEDPVWQLIVKKNLRVSVPDKYTEMPDGKGEGGRRRITAEEYYELLEGSGKQLKQYVLEHMTDFQQADEATAQKAMDEAATGIRGKWVYDLRKRAQ